MRGLELIGSNRGGIFMSDNQLKFVDDFPTPTYDQWVAEVDKANKGAPFEKKMLTKTYEGITVRPVYTRQDWPPAGDPSGFPGATRTSSVR